MCSNPDNTGDENCEEDSRDQNQSEEHTESSDTSERADANNFVPDFSGVLTALNALDEVRDAIDTSNLISADMAEALSHSISPEMLSSMSQPIVDPAILEAVQ